MQKLKNGLKHAFGIVKDAGSNWSEHKATRMGAALSYFTAFSIGPLILICIAIAGLIFGQEAATDQIFNQLRGLLGEDAASVVQEAVKNSSKQSSSIIATIIGVVSLLLGATGVFGELHDALNTIWGVKAKENQGILNFLRERFLSFTMVLGTGFLLIVSLVLTAALSVMGKWLSTSLPGGEGLWQVVNFIISLAVMSAIFTLILKYVPDIKIRWREVMIGGAVTAVLFTLGKFGLGIYIGKAGVASTYGAAGSLIVLLLWVFYSSQILYFGAELSRALADAYDVEVKPSRTAEKVMIDDKTPEHQGAGQLSRA